MKKKSTSYTPIVDVKAFRSGRAIFLSGIVGVISGLGAIVFNFMVFGCSDLFIIMGLGWEKVQVSQDAILLIPAEGLRYWLLPLVPALGGLMSGLLVFTLAPEAEGHGTDAYIRAFHKLRGKIRGRIPIIKTIASAITIGSGGSAGREGPIVQIGAGFGSWLGQILKLDARECRILMIAGTAGGIGAIFSAPLGGAILAIEILYMNQEMETEGLIPAIISALISYSVFSTLTGQTQIFHTPEFEFHASELIPYALLGVVCAFVGILYVIIFYGMRDFLFKKIPIMPHFLPMIGGLLMGLLALLRPEILSGGYGWIERALNEDLGISFMFSLVIFKILATSFTVSSGGSGGVFGPSLFIGCMLGATFGQTFELYFPNVIQDPRSFALVGMVAFFSGISKVPISGLLMVTEMSQSYQLLVPMMLVASLTYVLTGRWSLYEEQVWSKADSPAHFGEYRTDVLAGMKVKEIEVRHGFQVIPYNRTLRQILPVVMESSQNIFPVMNEKGEITGLFSIEELRALLLQEHVYDLIVAMDIATPEFDFATPEEDLHSVLRKMTKLTTDEIPVMDEQTLQFKGVINRRDILNLYSRRLVEIEQTAF
ncbi:MAG: chloride channel protein [bacterium]|jgi:CIC family chloride channel protein